MSSKLSNTHGILWDMDGVLVDSGDLHYAAWIEILSDYDIDFPRRQFDTTFGMNNMALITMLLGREPEPALYATINKRKEARLLALAEGRVQPMVGVIDWLARLQKAGYRQAIASSAPLTNIDTLVDAMGIRDYFDALVSGIDMPGKPEPDVFLTAADQLGLPAARCVVVEDAIPGVEGAKRAGMKCIAVTTTNSAAALAKADIVVDNLCQLPEDIFERLLPD
jgi:HAD superfamily hydrolase (TIGR01509 family)